MAAYVSLVGTTAGDSAAAERPVCPATVGITFHASARTMGLKIPVPASQFTLRDPSWLLVIYDAGVGSAGGRRRGRTVGRTSKIDVSPSLGRFVSLGPELSLRRGR